MKLPTILRVSLGVIAVLLACLCSMSFVSVWFVPKETGSVTKDLEFIAVWDIGCIAVGAGCVFLAKWCFAGRDSGKALQ